MKTKMKKLGSVNLQIFVLAWNSLVRMKMSNVFKFSFLGKQVLVPTVCEQYYVKITDMKCSWDVFLSLAKLQKFNLLAWTYNFLPNSFLFLSNRCFFRICIQSFFSGLRINAKKRCSRFNHIFFLHNVYIHQLAVFIIVKEKIRQSSFKKWFKYNRWV